MRNRMAQWLAIAFFAVLVAIVFQQIATSMTEQGIASGGPYDNAATYPRYIAIFIAVLVVFQIIHTVFRATDETVLSPSSGPMLRAVGLLAVFATYLLLLDGLGYHLTTTPMAFAMMWLCGGRNIGKLLIIALGMAFALAFTFEKILNVVLPGGLFGLNIPW